MRNTPEEFMPSLDEGSFLLMPTSMPHAGISENKRTLQLLDRAVMSIPEIETVVGKSGRIESALDPAPLSMFENIINYYPEYVLDASGSPDKFKVDASGFFVLQNGLLALNPNNRTEGDSNRVEAVNALEIDRSLLIPDANGEYFRNWRPFIQSSDAIWDEVVKVTALPGVTSAPKLQPIETPW